MILHAPFKISSRLLPAVTVADCTISLAPVAGRRGRPGWRAYFDFTDGREFVEDGLESGRADHSTDGAFASLLSFLSYEAGARSYARWRQRDRDEAPLFCDAVGEWAESHVDELDLLALEIDESGRGVLIED